MEIGAETWLETEEMLKMKQNVVWHSIYKQWELYKTVEFGKFCELAK